jgi:hypothetical protein
MRTTQWQMQLLDFARSTSIYGSAFTQREAQHSSILLKRIQNTFNASAAEVDYQDTWQSAQIAFAVVTNATLHANQMLTSILNGLKRIFRTFQLSRAY